MVLNTTCYLYPMFNKKVNRNTQKSEIGDFTMYSWLPSLNSPKIAQRMDRLIEIWCFFKGMAYNEKKWFEGANLKIENFGHTSFCDTSYFCKQIAFCRPQPILDDKTIFVRRAFVSLCIAIILPFRTHPNITIGNKSVFHSFPLPCAKKCRLIYAQFWCTWPSS